MNTFSDLIDTFGGAPAFAGLLGVRDSHVRTMKARGSIPPEYWPAITKLAKERGISGVTLSKLIELRAARNVAARSSEGVAA